MNWLAIFAKPGYRALLALFSGLLLTFSYAPFNQGWLAPVLVAVWLLLLVRSQTPRQALAVGFVFGFGWFSAGISWVFVSIDQFGGMPLVFSLLIMVILWAYLALFPMLASYLWFKTRHWYSGFSLFALPAIWLLAEFLRGWLFTGFPWLSLGYSQTSQTLGQLAPHIGETGLTLVVLLCALGFTYALLRKHIGWLLLPLSMYALGVLAPYLNPMQTTGESANVALVQGNIELEVKWNPNQQWPNLRKYVDMSRPYYGDYDLIVWPESAVTAIEDRAGSSLNQINQAALYNDTAVISGIIDLKVDRQNPQGNYFNSIVVMGEQEHPEGYYYGNKNRYEKHQLLPIGEFVPFESILRPLAPLFNLPMSSFARGNYVQPNLNANGYQIAANICYEVAFPRQIAAAVTDDTQLLLTVSNDSWFGDSHGPHQHLEIARMRAMELGRPMLRSTNSGVTALIDERGRRIKQADSFQATVATGRVALVEGTTWYRLFGQWPAWIASVLLLLAALRWRRITAKHVNQ
ncbi:apolipoprotein N-acyltransferase [Aliidiomarina sedimenti]|uniref:Apolipoprotein N-acyltransferase n=1 Tax=Aliidiomarina sedimenti TaxID=1933879 RepID=A0ABY0C387_9GAMM|nr:apolipoprotein N-acyltransferase [Aliidiomarina sedimenti]RUO32149.1 apolipoprotein N-acyltransferase [Aliidiomarina sedimenti]